MGGRIDLVTPEGVVEGWCWNESDPDEKITVIIAVDGAEVARATANLYRDDLKQAGIGDGHHAFRYALPLAKLEANRVHWLTLVDPVTGKAIGKAFEHRSLHTAGFDDRLCALEARAALLEGRAHELREAQVSTVTAAELFAVVGAFFERLARDVAHGESIKPERRLGESLRALTKSHAPIVFAPQARPVFSVVVEAAQPFDQIYACLSALKRAAARIETSVTVLDTGAFDEIALLPSLVRGVRYIRTDGDLVSEWGAAERDAESPFLVLLSGQAVVDDRFLDALWQGFDAHPRAGAIGGSQTAADGLPLHGGFGLFDGRLEDCARVGSPDERVSAAVRHPVHALSWQAAAVRRTAFQAVGGFDPAFGDDLGAATIDLSFRLREAGWSVLSEPRARVAAPTRSAQPWAPLALTVPSPAGDLLYQRWLGPAAAAPPPLVAGVAAVLARKGAFRDEVEAVRRLREAGYAVDYVDGGETVEQQAAEIVNTAGAVIRSKPGNDARSAPALIFAAAGDDVAATLPGKSKKAKVVVGLDQLKRVLHSRALLSAAAP